MFLWEWGGGRKLGREKGCVCITGLLFAIESKFICERSYTELNLVKKLQTSSDHQKCKVTQLEIFLVCITNREVIKPCR